MALIKLVVSQGLALNLVSLLEDCLIGACLSKTVVQTVILSTLSSFFCS